VRLDELERVTGRKLRKVHVVGGGSRSELLNQLTADSTRREVISGPVEATAIGNLLVQAMAMGDLQNLTVAREVVARSFPVERFIPREDSAAAWGQAQRRLAALAKR
jgi:sugar (pentulose or hexulose) kinase